MDVKVCSSMNFSETSLLIVEFRDCVDCVYVEVLSSARLLKILNIPFVYTYHVFKLLRNLYFTNLSSVATH